MTARKRQERREFLVQATGATLAMTGLPAPQSEGRASAVPAADLPPADLDALEQNVQSVLARKRLGQPVFVRYTLCEPRKEEERLTYLARMTDAACRWLAQPLERVFAVGTLASGTINLTLQFRQGATALISLAASPCLGDSVDLMVLGNHGALYHDAGQGPQWNGGTRYRSTQTDAKLTGLIERALRSGQPEQVEGRP